MDKLTDILYWLWVTLALLVVIQVALPMLCDIIADITDCVKELIRRMKK